MNFLSPQWMLLAGVVLSVFFQNDVLQLKIKKAATLILQLSIILLGASLNFHAVANQGISNILLTFVSIIFVYGTAYLLNKIFKIGKQQEQLITIGTAICGGSAIGALAPVIRADSFAITVSIAIVFLLNSLAVYIFPFVGELLNLTQEQFGTWTALAIHDTSSVVAASSIFGAKSLQVATTMKLIRALWIIPVTLFFSMRMKSGSKITFPWFILGFMATSLIFTFSDIPVYIGEQVGVIAKAGFSVTLFLIGLSFAPKKIKEVGVRPLLFGISLWLVVLIGTLIWVK